MVKGDSASGLLPGVNRDLGGKKGDGDHRIQAYCYRMCLTDVLENRVMIDKPEGYNEADYEILFRSIEAGQKDRFFKLSPLPNGKTDSNNSGGKAYGISYRAIVPPADECENLLVPWALSATHIAFGSLRMEPAFMILGQSAATAACIAIDDRSSVQEVPYAKLMERLVSDDQKITKK